MNDDRIRIARDNPLKDELNDYIELLRTVESASSALLARINEAGDKVHATQLLQSDILHVVELSDMDDITPKGAEALVKRLHDARVERRTAKILADALCGERARIKELKHYAYTLRQHMDNHLRFIPRGFKPRTKYAERIHQDLHHPDGLVVAPHLGDIERKNGLTYLVDESDVPISNHATVAEAVRAAYEHGMTLRRTPLNEQRLLGIDPDDDDFRAWRDEHLSAFGVDAPVLTEPESEHDPVEAVEEHDPVEDAPPATDPEPFAYAEPEVAVTDILPQRIPLDPHLSYTLHRDGTEWVLEGNKTEVARFKNTSDAFTSLVESKATRLDLNSSLTIMFELYMCALPPAQLRACEIWLAAVRRRQNKAFSL